MEAKSFPKKLIQDPIWQKLECIFIDFDGTLVDSIELLYGMYQYFLHEFGHSGSPEEFELLNGASFLEMVTFLNQKYQLGQDPWGLYQEYMQDLKKRYVDETQLFEGAREFLTYAKNTELAVVIVTGAKEELVEQVLVAQEIAPKIDAIMSAESLPRGKPDPVIYELSLKRLSLFPDQALAIEDAENGLRAAHGAGLNCLAFGRQGERMFSQGIPWTAPVLNWPKILKLFQQARKK